MAVFLYKAVNAEGAEVAGQIDADGVRQARAALLERQLYAVSLQAAAAAGKVSAQQLVRLPGPILTLLTRQWATLLDAGIPLEKSLATLAQQTDDEKSRQVLMAVRDELLGGRPLHQALAVRPRTFDTLYRAVIAAGEQSGQLGSVMARLADYLEQRNTLRQRVVQALVYPVLVVLVASLVVLVLMTYVVPQVVAVFQSSKQALPLLTRGLIAISSFLRTFWPVLLAGGGLLALVLRRAWRNPDSQEQMQQWLMRLPSVGRLLLTLDSARMAQTLSILVASGVPLLAALEAGSAVVWLAPMRRSLLEAANQVREGVSLHRALERGKLFPPMLVHMVGSGEATGRLDELLAKVARQQSEEVSGRLGMAMSLLEPLLILGMGLVVLLIVLAILQPIIEINQLVR